MTYICSKHHYVWTACYAFFFSAQLLSYFWHKYFRDIEFEFASWKDPLNFLLPSSCSYTSCFANLVCMHMIYCNFDKTLFSSSVFLFADGTKNYWGSISTFVRVQLFLHRLPPTLLKFSWGCWKSLLSVYNIFTYLTLNWIFQGKDDGVDKRFLYSI